MIFLSSDKCNYLSHKTLIILLHSFGPKTGFSGFTGRPCCIESLCPVNVTSVYVCTGSGAALPVAGSFLLFQETQVDSTKEPQNSIQEINNSAGESTTQCEEQYQPNLSSEELQEHSGRVHCSVLTVKVWNWQPHYFTLWYQCDF